MDSREDLNLKVVASRIRTDDEAANRIGAMLASVLNCKRDKEHKDRWKTDWGTKTNIGLSRTILSALETEGANYLKPNDEPIHGDRERCRNSGNNPETDAPQPIG